ncbi:hypothetical protein [Natrarchaeobaculum sulfurireducens]|uniref:Uncharacterized protein n=1 Tax=Natrarchaeobaculum sulfurireducens TaxID=2044521 RepID=A0A346PI84_9EURY|nr:hypothetical protein AArc1_2920 [Natrarchaeobaculum sulfurireducens]
MSEYLGDAPREIYETFALAYLANRAIHQREKRTVQILEDRPRSYRDELAAFFEDVSGERVTSNETYITISSAATQSLNLQPRYFVPEADS